MNFDADAVDLLRCPFCTASLRIERIVEERGRGRVEFGVLECSGCHFQYPVVAGIPILMAPHETLDSMFETNAVTLLGGPRLDQLIHLVKTNQPTQALSLLLNPSKLSGDWFFPLDLDSTSARGAPATGDVASGGRGARLRNRARRTLAPYVLPRARLRFADFLRTHEAAISAMDAMDLYYRRFSGTETFNYFAFRFGQPRHLAGLALASQLDHAKGPILDLACGVGHMTHYLAERHPGRVVIGSDRDFFRLWVATRYVAPNAYYVCAPADRALPFRERLFDGIFCSDAFHYFLSRAATVRDSARLLTQGGALILARFGNVAVKPNEGYELSVPGYAALFGEMPHVFRGEDELVSAYTKRCSPDLRLAEPTEALASQKWLSVVASYRRDTFGEGQRFEQWPHAVGQLQLNPIYVEKPESLGSDLALEFRFPSEWYEFENQAYLSYAPKTCSIPRDILRDLNSTDARSELDRYVSDFVVIGMPELYLQSRAATDRQ